jgi:putative two-component system response regulator
VPLHSKVLVVDDDPQTLASIGEVLRTHFRLSYATNGVDALEAAARILPDLILLDVGLPEIGGLDVCKRLKAQPQTASIPVIFVTSHSEAEVGVEGFAAGGVDFITKPISPEVLVARVKSHLSLVQVDQLKGAYTDAIAMLSIAGEYNDSDTGVHIRRMAAISAYIARERGWSNLQVERMELAAAMHDIGKIGVPGTILRKPGPLSTSEWQVMRSHPQIGYEILSVSSAPVFRLAAEIALGHHERWDGTGYPKGLAGTDIPESARIVALADVFDALTSARPYKKAWSVEASVEYIQQQSGTHFDPELIELFTRIVPQIVEVKTRWDHQLKAG